MRNLTRTTANTATQQFERALDRAWMQVKSGAMSYDQAVTNAVKGLARRGGREHPVPHRPYGHH